VVLFEGDRYERASLRITGNLAVGGQVGLPRRMDEQPLATIDFNGALGSTP